MLNIIRHDGPKDATPLLIVHGLYGSGRNLGVIAKKLSADREVLTVDQRNHGNSFWSDTHDYPAMAADLAEVIEAEGRRMDVMGHSMGGKAAMVLALTRPELVDHLMIADIAPVAYGHDQTEYIHAMRAVDLARVERRSDAEKMLADQGVERALQSFFTQSLDVKEKRWRLNLDVLEAEMPKIVGFPDDIGGTFDGPVLFLSGADSHYVRPEHRERIKSLFPNAKFAKIPDTGHWLHAEKPKEFIASAAYFLERR